MKLNNNRGITGIDISVALGIIVIFASIMASLSYNFVMSSRDIERKSKATYIAVETIEDLKQISYDSIGTQMQISDVEQLSGKQITTYDGYTVSITSSLYGEQDILKIVNVKVEYTVGKSTENVEITTSISKE